MPPTGLKKLSISSYPGIEFPSWLRDDLYCSLGFLRLSNCKNCLNLPPLGLLPSLKVLIIEGMDAVKTVGPEFLGMHK